MNEAKVLKFIRKSCKLICHQKKERCFEFKGYLFPICARCTGILLGFILSILFLIYNLYLNKILTVILLLIMFYDWLIQFLIIKKTSNLRRFIIGFIGGIGMSYFYYYIIMFFVEVFQLLF